MMRASIQALTMTLVCTSLVACAESEDDLDGGQSLRAAGEMVEFWNFRPNDPGNGEVQLSEDDDDDGLPDAIIWSSGSGEGGGSDIYTPGGDLVVSQVENQIFDADGYLRCTAYMEDGLFKLREGLDGDVVLTATQGRYVFWGDVQGLPQPGTGAWQELIYTQLAYEFYGDVVYDGPRWISDIVGYANVHIHKANPMRKLVFAAMFEGECGTADQQQPPPG